MVEHYSLKASMRSTGRALGLTALVLISAACGSSPEPTAPSPAPTSEPTKYYEAALKAAAWIDAQARETENGLDWGEKRELPELPPEISAEFLPFGLTLYSGTAGTIRFWLNAHRHTQDPGHLDRAVRGADELLARLPAAAPEDPNQIGFYGHYDGWAGILWTLEQVHQASGEPRFRDGARHLLDQIHASAQQAGDGVHWGETNELFYGNAGFGLILLWAAETFDHPESEVLAVRAGRWLLTSSEPRPGGRTWPWGPQNPDLVMPNFSHGTAGVAYFLAALYRRTGEQDFLDAALEGAGHLTEVAETADGKYCLVFHYENKGEREGGEDRYYLGFCHGPVGTSRMFEQLYLATQEEQWRQWVDQGSRAIAESGIPEQETPGFWNNVSQCCGSAGVIDHFVNQYRRTGNRAYLDFAKRMADNLLDRAEPEGEGLKWIQAEHRVKPELLEAQISYMQGAAGIAAALLHLDAALRELDVEPLRLVDDPW